MPLLDVIPYLVRVVGLNTWSRFCRTPSDLQTRRTRLKHTTQQSFCLLLDVRNEACPHTKCVEDISDENKLAGVELDHRGVRQELGALKHTSELNVKTQVLLFLLEDEW